MTGDAHRPLLVFVHERNQLAAVAGLQKGASDDCLGAYTEEARKDEVWARGAIDEMHLEVMSPPHEIIILIVYSI